MHERCRRQAIIYGLLSIVLLTLVLAACSTPDPGARPPEVPPKSSNATAPDLPARDTVQTGRLLVVKNGQLAQMERGALKILASEQRYQAPSFAPGGNRIAASIVGDNHSDLVLLDATGDRLQQFTNNWSKARVQDSAWARHPAWSPDGRSIAFVGDSSGDLMALWVLDVATAKARLLLAAPNLGGVDWPSWSPDGKEIAITQFNANSSQVVAVNTSSGGTESLTAQSEGAYDPAWSPDGTRIAFAARTNGRTDIWIADKRGNNPLRLTDVGTARAPAWSPSGDLVAFLADRGNDFDLYVVRPTYPLLQPVASSQLQRVTDGQHLDAPSGISWTR